MGSDCVRVRAFLGVMTMLWSNLDVTGYKMLNEANALNRNDLLSLESQLRKSHSPVYVVH